LYTKFSPKMNISGISDPGTELISACISAGIIVCPIPGPSAPITALSVSGFDSSVFTFYGFIPVKGKVCLLAFQQKLYDTRFVLVLS